MAKLTLADIDTTYASIGTVNANWALIEAALENTLSLDGTTPNAMQAQLDMNTNRIINVGEPVNGNDAVRFVDVQGTAVLPDQTGHATQYLQTDGTVANWFRPTASEITNVPSGSIAGTDVQAAIDELEAEKVDLAGDTMTGNLVFADAVRADFGAGADLKVHHDATNSYIENSTGELRIRSNTLELQDLAGTTVYLQADSNRVDFQQTSAIKVPSGTTAQRPGTPSNGDIRYNSTNSQLEGYVSGAWGGLGGASGASGDAVFYENDTNVTADYTITSGKNAMSAGPITIDAAVTVTVPTGSVWTIV